MKARDIGEVTTAGSDVDDPEILLRLPHELRAVLKETNGFILFHGGLHVRGAVCSPTWHSLRHVMESEDALHRLYSSIKETDIPFAEDCVGDQYILRDGEVWCLRAETGDLEITSENLGAFWTAVAQDPHEFLNFNSDMRLEPGQLLHAYPPFCFKESGKGAELKPVPALELIRFHADLAKQIANLPEGAAIQFKVTE